MSRNKKSRRQASSSNGQAPFAASVVAALWTVGMLVVLYRRGVNPQIKVWGEFASILSLSGSVLAAGLLRDLVLLGGFIFVFERLGAAVTGRLGLPARREPLLRIGIGAGTASLSLLLLGLARLWNPLFLQLLFYGGLLLGGVHWYRGRTDESFARVPVRGDQEGWGAFQWATAALIVCGMLMTLLASALPEIFYDSLVYHLALPQLYLFRGGIVPTPENVYSGLPFGVQMLFGWALALADENLAALVHAAFGAGTAWALWDWGKRYASSRTGLLAAALFYLCPVALYASWHCGVDLGASFFSVLVLHAISRSLEEGERENGNGWAVAAGLFTGFAMSTKYNVFPLGLAMVGAHFFFGRRAGRPAGHSLRMALVALAVVAPWLLKNLFFFGNPMYPFMHDWIGFVRPVDWQGFLNAAGSRDLGSSLASWSGIKDMLLAPWKFSLGDWPTGDWPGSAFILLTPWALLRGWGLLRKGEETPGGAPAAQRVVLLLAIVGYFLWLLSSRLVRYALPVIPFIALVAALAVERGGHPRWLRRVGWAGMLAACLFNFEVAYWQAALIGQWKYIKGGQDKSAYLKLQRTTYGLPYYAAMEFIEKSTPKDAKILFLGESRAYYSPRDFIASTLYDTNPFWTAVKESKNSTELHRRVREMGITHIFLSARQMVYHRASPAILPRELVRGRTFRLFWARYLVELFEDREDHGSDPRWLVVYRVLEAPNVNKKTFAENPAYTVLDYLDRAEQSDGSLINPR